MRGWHRVLSSAQELCADQCWMFPLLMALLSLLDCRLDFYMCYKKQTNKQNIINNKINEAIPLFHFCCCSGTIHRRHRSSQQAGGCVWQL